MTQDRRTTVIARTVTRTVVPIIVVTAFALLFQGHNLPGGGFIAGVLTATAFALVYVIYGQQFLQEDLLDLSPDDGLLTGAVQVYARTFALGLALAAGSGIAAIAFGYEFLTQAVLLFEWHTVPVVGPYMAGKFEVASAFAFDLGVYFVVVGGLLTILAVVGRE